MHEQLLAAKYASNPLLPPSVAAVIASAAAGVTPTVGSAATVPLNLSLPPPPVMAP